MELLKKHSNQIQNLCKLYKVKYLYAFGSVTSDQLRVTSDIDFLVKFDGVHEREYFDNYLGLKEAFEKVFQRPVDLLEEQSLTNPVLRSSIDKSRQLVYG